MRIPHSLFRHKDSEDILQTDIIDKTIDEFIIKNKLVGKIPLTSELRRVRI